jgi:hypothetical protein
MNAGPYASRTKLAFTPGTGHDDDARKRCGFLQSMQQVQTYREWATVKEDNNFWRRGRGGNQFGIGAKQVHDLPKFRVLNIASHKHQWPTWGEPQSFFTLKDLRHSAF